MRRTRRSSAIAATALVASLLVATSACGTSEDASKSAANGATIAPVPPPGTGPSVAAFADTSLAAFWTHFRHAIEARDTVALLALTDRTFATRGETDDDPWIQRDSAAVVAILDSLLNSDPGLGRESSMRAMVLATNTTGLARQVAGGELRVGSFVFEVRDGRWRWVKAYLP